MSEPKIKNKVSIERCFRCENWRYYYPSATDILTKKDFGWTQKWICDKDGELDYTVSLCPEHLFL